LIQSMTAFASRTGTHGPECWAWEMRGVNARGLDLRLRLPEGIDGLEVAVRAMLNARLRRGNVSVTLRMTRQEAAQAVVLDEAQLDRVLAALGQVQDRALEMGVTLGQPTVADVLSQRGVIVPGNAAAVPDDGLAKALIRDLERLIDDFVVMRRAEGTALHAVIAAQLDTIDRLTGAAAQAAVARAPAARAALRAALQRVMDDVMEADETRIAQELALLSVKADITEEIDRLRAHVIAARDLLDDAHPSGRRLDFLAQEFNREANTLCAKAGSAALTRIGLDLKATIDQMREQIQNVE